MSLWISLQSVETASFCFFNLFFINLVSPQPSCVRLGYGLVTVDYYYFFEEPSFSVSALLLSSLLH